MNFALFLIIDKFNRSMKYTISFVLAFLFVTVKYVAAYDEDYYIEYEEDEGPSNHYPENEKELYFYGRNDSEGYREPSNYTEGEVARFEYLWEIDKYI